MDLEIQRTACLRHLTGLHLKVESIAESIPCADAFHCELGDLLRWRVEGAGLRSLTIEQSEDLPGAPALVLNPRIYPISGDGGQAAGYISVAELCLSERVALWDDPTILIRAITWKNGCMFATNPSDDLMAACIGHIGGLIYTFAQDVATARLRGVTSRDSMLR